MLRNLTVLALSLYSVSTLASIQILMVEYAPDFIVRTGNPSIQNTADNMQSTDSATSTQNAITSNDNPVNSSIPALQAPAPTGTQLPDGTTPPVDAKYSYNIKYDDTSPVKDVPLDNSNLKVQVYYNGNPQGYDLVKTDGSNNFIFQKYADSNSVVIEVLSVENQEKYHASCSGNMKSIGAHEITIICKHVT